MNTFKTSRDKLDFGGKGGSALKNSRTVKPFKFNSPRISEGQKDTRKDKIPKARNDKNIIQRTKPESLLGSNVKETKIRPRTFAKNSGGFLEKRTAERKSRILEGINVDRQRKREIVDKTAVEGDSIDRSLAEDRRLETNHRRTRKIHSGVRYEESSSIVDPVNHHKHIHHYRDRHYRLCHRIVWPRYYYPLYYSYGPYYRVRYVYPYYHRRYLFVSLGGYWPAHYRYVRYYWYGYHPYEWYGYYPIPYEVKSDNYNYYTYNYYGTGASDTVTYDAVGGLAEVDGSTFADVREKLAAEQAVEPDAETLADTYFEKAVEAFEQGQYTRAADLFANAMELAPEDVILPFAYAQALFAGEHYQDAAEVIRMAISSVDAEEEGVFYPRGLYPNDETLLAQIDILETTVELNSSDFNLQLLLGYQLLGIGELETANEHLQLASQDLSNAPSANILLNLLETIRAANTQE
ncbi:MAG: tetratricopeptide repeat protein [Planctomycetota bacterium]|jgi:tetratricopeptide (TPR) repeat protein